MRESLPSPSCGALGSPPAEGPPPAVIQISSGEKAAPSGEGLQVEEDTPVLWKRLREQQYLRRGRRECLRFGNHRRPRASSAGCPSIGAGGREGPQNGSQERSSGSARWRTLQRRPREWHSKRVVLRKSGKNRNGCEWVGEDSLSQELEEASSLGGGDDDESPADLTPRSCALPPGGAAVEGGAAVGDKAAGALGAESRSPFDGASDDTAAWDDIEQTAIEEILEEIWLQKAQNATKTSTHIDQATLETLVRPRAYDLVGVELLGSGAYGLVHKVKRHGCQQVLAMKRQPFQVDMLKDTAAVFREASILSMLRGASNVVQITDAFIICQPRSGKTEACLVLEHFPHTLMTVSAKCRKEDMARRVIFQILVGLRALHSRDVVHRDLKPENVLVDLGNDAPSSLRVALCDFGSARSVHGFRASKEDGKTKTTPQERKRRSTRKASVCVTTCTYRCPELWHWADMSRMTKQDLKSLDVFALGLIWAELFTQRRIITHNEAFEPQSFRLLEILRKVDRPTEADLRELQFTEQVCSVAGKVLFGEPIGFFRPKLTALAEKYAKRAAYWEALLREPYTGLRKEIMRRTSRDVLSERSGALELIERAARFSYRQRTSVLAMLSDPYFSDEVQSAPQRSPASWTPSDACKFEDMHDALETEIQKLSTLMKHKAADSDSTAAVCSEAARVERTCMRQAVASGVRSVCHLVRSEFAAIARRR